MALFPEIDIRVDGQIESTKEEIHRFAAEQLRPISIEIDKMSDEEYQKKIADRESSPWWKAMKQIKKLGYNKVFVPEAVGGPELTPLERWVIAEELAWGGAGFTISIGVDECALFWALLAGKMDLVEEIMKKLEKTDEQGCWGVTEPEHGSDCILTGTPYPHDPDVGTLNCKARIEGDEVVIEGAKSSWVSTAPCSTYCALHVGFTEEGVTLADTTGVVYVPYPYEGGKGMEKGKPLLKIGHRDNPQGELFFKEYRVPKDYILVPPKVHQKHFFEGMQHVFWSLTSTIMAVSWIGHARACLEEAIRYAKERKQGGKFIWEHQLTQQKLYDMYERVVTARTYARTCFEHIWDKLVVKQRPEELDHSAVAVLQVYSKRIAFEVANLAVQIHGANGITRDYVIEKLFRDTRPALIEDGTPDMFAIQLGYDIIRRYRV